ncbi:MAG: hypothetical protein LQ340_000423 [Diploschistes diacapsis]|nr:MAG: hypothetical protein LQ340_000423 [Diploschistes diacapsis]
MAGHRHLNLDGHALEHSMYLTRTAQDNTYLSEKAFEQPYSQSQYLNQPLLRRDAANPTIFDDDLDEYGSGKTAVLELAICKLVAESDIEQCKIVYVAPTKSLCSERQRDWQLKFENLGLQCAELTGDTDYAQQAHVQRANLIITTPEKWDSTTRKWKDRSKLLQLVKLFLIDEVHILKESRGATLEAIVSRMKSTGLDMRFIALSATVPNSGDIAAWLGRSKVDRVTPARLEVFGEEFRPVQLQKHVVGIRFHGNDFAFDQVCDDNRPQFDRSAVAVIITKMEKVPKYEKLVAGEEIVESWYEEFEGRASIF